MTARGWEDLSELLKAYESLGVPVTEPVIREYLAWDRAAEDFAAYYRLYETYREAYPAEEILEGTASADALARASRQLRDALPEERMAAAQLLLDGARRRLGSGSGSGRTRRFFFERRRCSGSGRRKARSRWRPFWTSRSGL